MAVSATVVRKIKGDVMLCETSLSPDDITESFVFSKEGKNISTITHPLRMYFAISDDSGKVVAYARLYIGGGRGKEKAFMSNTYDILNEIAKEPLSEEVQVYSIRPLDEVGVYPKMYTFEGCRAPRWCR